VDLREPETAVFLGDLHPHRADLLEALDDLVGDLRVALDLVRIYLIDEEFPQRGEEFLALFDRLGAELRLGMDQVKPEVAEEELLAEARQLPLLLARGFGDLPGLAFADVGRSHPLITPQLGRRIRRLHHTYAPVARRSHRFPRPRRPRSRGVPRSRDR